MVVSSENAKLCLNEKENNGYFTACFSMLLLKEHRGHFKYVYSLCLTLPTRRRAIFLPEIELITVNIKQIEQRILVVYRRCYAITSIEGL